MRSAHITKNSGRRLSMIRSIRRLVSIALLLLFGTGCQVFFRVTPIDPDKVRTIVNPYGIAPLAALIDVSAETGISEEDVREVMVTLTDAKGRSETFEIPYGSPEYEVNYGVPDIAGLSKDGVIIPVLGLFADTTTSVKVQIVVGSSRRRFVYEERITARLESDESDLLRNGYPVISAVTKSAKEMEPGMTLLSFSIGNKGRFITRPIIIDASGVVRWVLRLDSLGEWASPVERLENGNLLFGQGRYVYEYSMLGRRVNAWDIGRYGYTQHHDIFEITSGERKGNLVVAVDRIKADTVEDFVIEIDRNGALVNTWDFRQVLDVSRHDLLKNRSDWLHMNALYHDPRDDTLVVSGRNQGVVKVDGRNSLKWIMAPHKGWGAAGASGESFDTSEYLLTAISADGTPYPREVQLGLADVGGGTEFDWPWGQHAPLLLPNGDILLFDNGFNRNFKGNKSGFSRAVEYRVDEKARTVRQIWQYGAERGDDFFSNIISDADMLDKTKNRLITSGAVRVSPDDPHAYVTEVKYPGGAVVHEVRIAFKDAYADLKKGGWGNIDIVYRAERLPLYPNFAQPPNRRFFPTLSRSPS
jgi:arylsulfate sulfotransferase